MSDTQQKRAVALTQKFLEKVSLNDNVSLLVAALTFNEKAALLKEITGNLVPSLNMLSHGIRQQVLELMHDAGMSRRALRESGGFLVGKKLWAKILKDYEQLQYSTNPRSVYMETRQCAKKYTKTYYGDWY